MYTRRSIMPTFRFTRSIAVAILPGLKYRFARKVAAPLRRVYQRLRWPSMLLWRSKLPKKPREWRALQNNNQRDQFERRSTWS